MSRDIPTVLSPTLDLQSPTHSWDPEGRDDLSATYDLEPSPPPSPQPGDEKLRVRLIKELTLRLHDEIDRLKEDITVLRREASSKNSIIEKLVTFVTTVIGDNYEFVVVVLRVRSCSLKVQFLYKSFNFDFLSISFFSNHLI